MLGFNYENFKAALRRVEEENYARLMADVAKVKAFVERALTLFLESSANMANTQYHGVEL